MHANRLSGTHDQTKRAVRVPPADSIPTGSTRQSRTRRIHVEVSTEEYERLTELSHIAYVRSMAELVNMSLRFLQWYQRRRQEGYRIQIVKDATVTTTTEPPASRHVKL